MCVEREKMKRGTLYTHIYIYNNNNNNTNNNNDDDDDDDNGEMGDG